MYSELGWLVARRGPSGYSAETSKGRNFSDPLGLGAPSSSAEPMIGRLYISDFPNKWGAGMSVCGVNYYSARRGC